MKVCQRCCVANSLQFDFSLAEFMPQVKVEQVETVEGCSHEVNNNNSNYFLAQLLMQTKLIFQHYTGILNIFYSMLQVALPLNDEYKPLKARVGKAAKV